MDESQGIPTYSPENHPCGGGGDAAHRQGSMLTTRSTQDVAASDARLPRGACGRRPCDFGMAATISDPSNPARPRDSIPAALAQRLPHDFGAPVRGKWLCAGEFWMRWFGPCQPGRSGNSTASVRPPGWGRAGARGFQAWSGARRRTLRVRCRTGSAGRLLEWHSRVKCRMRHELPPLCLKCHEFFLKRRWNESEIGLLDHYQTGPGLGCHSQWINTVNLQQLADARVTETLGARLGRNAILTPSFLIVCSDGGTDPPRPDVAPPGLFAVLGEERCARKLVGSSATEEFDALGAQDCMANPELGRLALAMRESKGRALKIGDSRCRELSRL
jgi:hypothetical protein